MAAPRRMLRLLQGDVGSGKTVVALMAMLNAVECGGQAALMAPTEILARQHHETIAPLAASIGLKAVVLTGRDKGAARRDILAALAEGRAPLAVGTHALFQDDVAFRDLKLAIVDEQHRFGVHQRMTMASKGARADMLVMTATPIPRTLTMTAYGDLDVSRLVDKPPGRKPIKTVVIAETRRHEVIDALTRKLAEGAKIYWVCPLVEESETSDMANAEGRYADLRHAFGEDRVALVHGRMKGKEKDAAMAKFVDGPADILVATTVIEVGVNVPAATVMVIEQAERFGLAQLHQLRGRIGRGDVASTCLLVRSERLSDTARERLRTMTETEDGFLIAEKDLELRGAGEILGTKQSGLPDFRLADIAVHGDLMRVAHDDARLILERDPDLENERGKTLRLLLYLFERDAAIANLKSG
jgi:ATP-dependent DNA helicase RecG